MSDEKQEQAQKAAAKEKPLWIVIDDRDILRDKADKEKLATREMTSKQGKSYELHTARFAKGVKIGEHDVSYGRLDLFAASLVPSRLNSKEKGADQPTWVYPLDKARTYSVSIPHHDDVTDKTDWERLRFTPEEIKQGFIDSRAVHTQSHDSQTRRVWISASKEMARDDGTITAKESGKEYPMKRVELPDGSHFRTFATNVMHNKKDDSKVWISLPEDTKVYLYPGDGKKYEIVNPWQLKEKMDRQTKGVEHAAEEIGAKEQEGPSGHDEYEEPEQGQLDLYGEEIQF